MDHLLSAEEAYFVKEFIVPNRRERVCWELEHEQKRSGCIWRFAHCARELLRPSLIHPVLIQKGEFVLDGKDFLREIGNPKVFIMDSPKEWDRVIMDFQSAFDEYLGSGPYIMIDCKLTFAFIETESDCETHEFLYMHK